MDNIYNLTQLNDYDFSEAVSKAIHQRHSWKEFLQPNVIERTRATLVRLKVVLIAQVKSFDEDADPDWMRRIHHKMRVIDNRMTEVNIQIKADNKRATASVHAASQKYGGFAYKLACALRESDRAFMLDEIFLDDIVASEWLHRREEIRQLKELKANALQGESQPTPHTSHHSLSRT